jgi:hypothetical protein
MFAGSVARIVIDVDVVVVEWFQNISWGISNLVLVPSEAFGPTER